MYEPGGREELYPVPASYLPYHLFLCLVLQDIQAQGPPHLLRLKVDLEQSRVAVILQDCRAELDREMRALSSTCSSELVIQEHRVSPGF